MKPSFLQVLGTHPDVASLSSMNRTQGEGLSSLSVLALFLPMWDLFASSNQQELEGQAPRKGLGLEPGSEYSPQPSSSSWAWQHGDTLGCSAALPLMGLEVEGMRGQ